MRLVLIYLGSSIPKLFWQSTQHLLSIQSKYQIDIITSNQLAEHPIKDPRVRYFRYQPKSDVTNSLDYLDIDDSFRNGFWRFSLERLFAFTQHHEQVTNEPLLHIESDILLFRNFPFREFEELEKLTWSRVDENRDVAALVFSPSYETSQWLHDTMLSLIVNTKDTDDMRLLSQISRNNPNRVDILPSIPKPDSQLLNQQIDAAREDCEALYSDFETFQGIFDPAGIGIWLTGTDPRNNFGVTTKFDSRLISKSANYIDPSQVEFEFKQESGLSYLDREASTSIFTLHIHSKDQKYFSPEFELAIENDVKASILGMKVKFFSLPVLIKLIIHNWQKGTLWGFLSWLPIVRQIKKLLRVTR